MDMPTFTANGILVVPAFLTPEMCAQVRHEMRIGTSQKAGLYVPLANRRDDEIRKTKTIQISRQGVFFITYQLMNFRPILERFFQESWLGCQVPQFLHYTTGDFFERHLDEINNPQTIDYERKLTVLLFLNAPDLAEEPFEGGQLLFFDLHDERGQTLSPHILPIQTGMLVAFLPHLHHEVTPIIAGQRYSVVTWFY